MKNAFVLARKDFAAYFYSWSGVVIFAFFFVLAGLFFSFLVLNYSKISFDAARTAYQGVQGLGLTRFVFGSFTLYLAVYSYPATTLTSRM